MGMDLVLSSQEENGVMCHPARWPGCRLHGAFTLMLLCVVASAARAGKEGGASLSTTLEDYFQPGTQPLGAGVPSSFAPMLSSGNCTGCHANYGPQGDPELMVEPYATWVASMMAQSGRDPLFYAGLTIANQDAADAGQFCIRCHVPNGFLSGHAVPTNGSALDPVDQEGVSCNFCHRLVNPEFTQGTSPAQDQAIINELQSADLLPPQGSNSRYVVDPTDSRRGPFNDIPANLHPGSPQPQIIHSPFHTKAELCWNCHDVSNPLMTKDANGNYNLNELQVAHPTHEQSDMLPLHRTYSEWKNSYYSSIGVQHNGRFGGNHPTGVMKDCQDCHMPDTIGYGCNFEFDPFFERPNVPQHSFAGSNTWVLNAVRTVDFNNDSKPDFPDAVTGLTDELVAMAIARNIDFLEKASDLELSHVNGQLRTRVINRTGHKLPTGFPDGRRIWINVRFLDCGGNPVQEHGAYDFETADLDAATTKVYEMLLGIQGADYAQQIGHPEGQTFHFMLANVILKDNRVPPAGHSVLVAQTNQTQPVGAVYSNGQHWDDTLFPIPAAARSAIVTVYYQLNSKPFIEHLRDANVTDNRGLVAHALWEQYGKSTPVAMDSVQATVYPTVDINADGVVNVSDLLAVINAWGSCPNPPQPCPADVNRDGIVSVEDLLAVINAWDSC